VTLWYGTILDLPSKLIEELYDYVHLLEKYIKFCPRILTIECPSCVNEVREMECFSKGRYCLVPPKDEIGALYPELTDRNLLEENLIERCVHDVISKEGEADDIRYFNYLYNLRQECLHKDRDLKWHCQNRVL